MRETFTSWRSQSSFRQSWLTRPIYSGLFYCYCDIWHCGPYCAVPHIVPCLHCATFQGHTVVHKRLKLRGPLSFLQDAIYFISMVVILKVLFLKKLRLGGKIRERGIRCLQALKKNVLTRDHWGQHFFAECRSALLWKKVFLLKLNYNTLVWFLWQKRQSVLPVPAKRGVNRSHEHVTHRYRCKDLIHKFNQLRLKDEL